MNNSDRVLVAAALADDGQPKAGEIASLLEITQNNVQVVAVYLRKSGMLRAASGRGYLQPTAQGYKRACRLLGVSQ